MTISEVLATDHRPETRAPARGAVGWRRRRDIQGLRGIAVLLVVMFHAGLNVPGGFTGVDVFFVISGFVIGGVLLTELEQTGRVDLLRFYGRRVRRLLPALAVMVTIVALAGVLLAPVAGQHTGGITGILASLFSANIYLFRDGAGYFASDEALNPFLQTWTLAVEEQFYILFPTLLVLSWVLGRSARRTGGRSRAAVVIGLTSLASFALALKLSSGPPGGLTTDQRFAFYSAPTRAWEFGLGALLVLASPLVRRLPSIVAAVLGVLGVTAILIAAVDIQGTSNYPSVQALVPTLGACAILAAGTIDDGGVAAIIRMPPLAWLGDLSYSWYLWHWPLIVFAVALWPTHRVPAATAAAALSLLPAWASFRHVENPIRSTPQFTGRRLVALATVCVALPILACSGLLAFSDALDSRAGLAAWRLSQQAHLDHARGCDSGQPVGSQPPRCTWRVQHARGRLVLVGDSYAGHVTEAVVTAGNAEGFDVTVATFPACPFLDVRVYRSVLDEPHCRLYYTRGLQALLRMRPSLVVTSFRAGHYTEDSQIELAVGSRRQAAGPAVTKESALERGLASTLKTLNARGIPVLVVDPIPTHPREMGACAAVRVMTESCPLTVSRGVVDRRLAGPIRIDELAVGRATRSYRLNLENRLCSKTQCSVVAHRVVMYRDANHLSVAATREVTDLFRRAIRRFAAND
jgi:peptidoglycan/LPS O-acetylase OafA/YrhL